MVSAEEPVRSEERSVYNVVTSDETMALTSAFVHSSTSAGVKRWGV
jgi:hypothetical protein